MSVTVTIDPRFNGPPDSANGGYACGVVASGLGDAGTATLRQPPPLDVELALINKAGGTQLSRGDRLIAEASTDRLDLEVPDPPALDQAREASRAYTGFDWHGFPTCFVCGPQRDEGDGLRIFPGKVEGRELVAAAWTPDESLPAECGSLRPEIVWAALDCPTYFGGRLRDYPPVAVLGRLAARLDQPVEVGTPHVVIGWPLDGEGRKWSGGSAIFTAEGKLCAAGRGLWIELKGAPAG